MERERYIAGFCQGETCFLAIEVTDLPYWLPEPFLTGAERAARCENRINRIPPGDTEEDAEDLGPWLENPGEKGDRE
jgi:hypothetical protein